MTDLVLTTELIQDFDNMRKAQQKSNTQSGGFVFPLIPEITKAMMKVPGLIWDGITNNWRWFFNLKFTKKYVDTETGEEKSRWTLGWINGEGNVWKFLWFCVKTSLYLVIFALGGFWFTLLGIGYIYSKLAGKFSEMQGNNSNEN